VPNICSKKLFGATFLKGCFGSTFSKGGLLKVVLAPPF